LGTHDLEPRFRHHHSTGLVDCLSIERLSVAEVDRDVVTIEKHLADVLAEYAAADGWEVVVVNHPDPESTTLVNDAGRLDGDARACLRRCSR
jgi:hypothetical protein